MTRWSILPICLVALLYGIVGPAPVAGVLAALALFAGFWPHRLAWPRSTQLLVFVPLFIVAVIAVATLFPQPPTALLELRTPWRAFAGAALLVAVGRLYLAEPIGREPATLALALLALTACGGTFRAEIYPFFVLAFLASAAIARHAADEGSGPPLEAIRTRAAAVAGLLAVAATIVALFVTALPSMHQWAVEKLMERGDLAMTGFSERMWLGSLRGLLDSDEKVLRLRGEAGGALLRGIVYDEYAGARWSRAEGFVTVEPASLGEAMSIEIEIIDPEPERYFLPLGAEAIAVSSGIARVDSMGVLAAIAAEPATRVWYRPGDVHGYAVAPPNQSDLSLPRPIARALRPFAIEFTRGLDSDEAKLEAIVTALQARNHYSLEVPWSGREDPVVAFVREGRGGHCEYFASAMALLARAAGVPARVVGGYRVIERNPVGGHFVVRERDAHAWVEAWLPGRGWTTWDPTPASFAGSDRASTPLLSALWDYGGTQWLAFLEWLDRRTPVEMIIPPLALIALAITLRALRRRRTVVVSEGPPSFFLEVCRALDDLGLRRQPNETPTQLAARIGDLGLSGDLSSRAASWLAAYADHRYGRRGSEAELSRSAAALCRDLEA